MDDPKPGIDVTLARQDGFRFRIRFGTGIPELVTDEPPPLGKGEGASPSMMLAAAVGNCLASSLLFCLGKARIEAHELEAEVRLEMGRSDEGRLRIRGIDVRLVPAVIPEDQQRMGRCLEVFEQFCTVTESVRHGIEVRVGVEPKAIALVERRSEAV